MDICPLTPTYIQFDPPKRDAFSPADQIARKLGVIIQAVRLHPAAHREARSVFTSALLEWQVKTDMCLFTPTYIQRIRWQSGVIGQAVHLHPAAHREDRSVLVSAPLRQSGYGHRLVILLLSGDQ